LTDEFGVVCGFCHDVLDEEFAEFTVRLGAG
jgi:hypothetical protein